MIKVPDRVMLLASAARHDSIDGDAVLGWRGINAMVFAVELTAGSRILDTLDVQIQTSIDAVNWIPLYDFTQIDGAASPDTFAKLIHSLNHVAVSGLAEFDITDSLGGSERAVFGPYFRAVATLAVFESTETFTFGVSMTPFMADVGVEQE